MSRLGRLAKLPLRLKHYFLGHKWTYIRRNYLTKERYCSCGAYEFYVLSSVTGKWELDILPKSFDAEVKHIDRYS